MQPDGAGFSSIGHLSTDVLSKVCKSLAHNRSVTCCLHCDVRPAQALLTITSGWRTHGVQLAQSTYDRAVNQGNNHRSIIAVRYKFPRLLLFRFLRRLSVSKPRDTPYFPKSRGERQKSYDSKSVSNLVCCLLHCPPTLVQAPLNG
jgi:hypothetical protein